jgi:hypothetical protein
MELDFLYEENGAHQAIKIADANVGGGEGFCTYPLYYLGFLPQKPKTNIIKMIDVKNIKVPDIMQVLRETREDN